MARHPILIRVSQGDKRKYISTGYSSSIADWDFKENLPKKKHPYYDDLIIIIRVKLAESSKLHIMDVVEERDSSIEDILKS